MIGGLKSILATLPPTKELLQSFGSRAAEPHLGLNGWCYSPDFHYIKDATSTSILPIDTLPLQHAKGSLSIEDPMCCHLSTKDPIMSDLGRAGNVALY